MIDYGLFEFASPPHTGVGWMLKAAQVVGLGPGFRSRAAEPWEDNESDKPRLSLVCNPVLWMESCWSWRGTLPIECHEFRNLAGESYEQFVRSYLFKCPGAIGRLFGVYGSGIVQRLEDQPRALRELMASLGVDHRLIRNLDLLGGPDKTWPNFTPGVLHDAIMRAERELAEQYDYW